MNELKIFTNSTFGNVRVIKQNGEPWFVAKDVCDCLGLGDTSKAVGRLEADEKGTNSIPTPGGHQNLLTVNEYGLYNLILSSRKPEAKEFKRWITHDVIPNIRQHGAYMTIDTVERAMNDPDFIIGLLTNFKQIKTEKEQALKQIEADKPKVLFADTVSSSHTSILIGELAKIMKQAGLNVGQNRLFERLRQDGYLISRKGTDYNMPTQKARDNNTLLIVIWGNVYRTKSKGAGAMKKTVSVRQMAAVLGYTSTAVRECIALGRYPFAQCWKTPGRKGRTFAIDRLGFTFYLTHTLGWSEKAIAAEFKAAGLE